MSPVLTTTPALATISVNYDDLTDEQKEDGVYINVAGSFDPDETYTLTFTPTPTWYGFDGDNLGEQGAPVTVEGFVDNGVLYFEGIGLTNSNNPDDITEFFLVTLSVKAIAIEDITISPAIEGLDLAQYVPVYIGDIQRYNTDPLPLGEPGTEYTVTVTPSANTYACHGGVYGNKGEAKAYTVTVDVHGDLYIDVTGETTNDGAGSVGELVVRIPTSN